MFWKGGVGYFSLLSRVPGFLVGSLLALMEYENRAGSKNAETTSYIGLFLVVASFVFINEDYPFPGFLAMPATLGIALVIYSSGSKVNNLLSNKWLGFLGALSYSLYLWHWPILAAFRYYYETYVLSYSAAVAALLLMFAMAYISYSLIERKYLKLFSLRARLVYAGALAAIVPLVLFASSYANEKLVDKLPVELTRYAPASEICHGKIAEDCVRGNGDSTLHVLLIGDSHAAQLNHFADVIGKDLNASIRVITASSCVNIPNFDYERIPQGAQRACAKQIEEAERYYEDADGIILAGKWVYHYKSEKFLGALDSFFQG